MKYLDRKGLVQIIYGIMMADGQISESEAKQFDEIGLEIDPDGFLEYKDNLVSDCNERLSKYIDDQDYYDILQEYIDSMIVYLEPEHLVVPRYVIWNLFAVAYNEETLDMEEQRLIRHVARSLDMSKADYLELEQYMKSIVEMRLELKSLESSDKPYVEIRPRIELNKQRQKTIMDSVATLISDELYEYSQKSKNVGGDNKSNIWEKISIATNKVSDTAGKVATNVKSKYASKIAPKAAVLGAEAKQGLMSAAKTFGGVSSVFVNRMKSKDKDENEE